MDDATKTAIQDALLDLITQTLPDAGTRSMYGGTVIELDPGNPKSRIGGVFVYDHHVSVEFTHGADLVDPTTVLEGSGKKRRHVKLRSVDDIAAKNCAGFLAQAAGQ